MVTSYELDIGGRVETHFPSLPSSPALARAFLRSALQTWNLDGFGDVTELLTDELVSNVVRHVGRAMTVRAICHPGWIRVEVADASSDLPILRQPDPDAVSGRGLPLVDALSDRWGTEMLETGKCVWFELDLRTTTGDVHGGGSDRDQRAQRGERNASSWRIQYRRVFRFTPSSRAICVIAPCS